MAHFYVANTTRQTQVLQYRRPTTKNANGKQLWGQLFSETIPPGRQMRIPGEFTDAEAALIFEHQAKHFGAVRDKPGRVKGFVGLIWSNEPIKTDSIDEGVKTNREAAEARSDRMLDVTAAAILDNQSKLAQEQDLPVPAAATVEIVPEAIKGGPVSQAKGTEALQQGVQPRNRETRAALR